VATHANQVAMPVNHQVLPTTSVAIVKPMAIVLRPIACQAPANPLVEEQQTWLRAVIAKPVQIVCQLIAQLETCVNLAATKTSLPVLPICLDVIVNPLVTVCHLLALIVSVSLLVVGKAVLLRVVIAKTPPIVFQTTAHLVICVSQDVMLTSPLVPLMYLVAIVKPGLTAAPVHAQVAYVYQLVEELLA
jgi:hypothetical protein